MTFPDRPRLLLSLAVVGVAVGLAGCSVFDGGGSGCQSLPRGLAPAGSGPNAYTMVLRVNTESDVKELASSPLRPKILDRDVLLINTEYRTMNPTEAERVLDRAREAFPCNRIASLNGLSPEKKRPGYRFSLAGNPELDAVIVDWEESTWEEVGKGAWSNSLSVNVERAREELRQISRKIEDAPGEPQTRVGLATEYREDWNYAELGRELALLNAELRQDFLGYQLVQSQNRCAGTQKVASIAEVADALRSQYEELASGAPDPDVPGATPALGRKILDHLGFEVSFSANPQSGSGLAVTRDSPEDAARCSRDVLRTGSGAIIYWATPEAIEKMLDTSIGRELRPG